MVYLCSQCGGYHDPPRRKSSIADNADTISKQPPEGRRGAGTESDNLLNNILSDVSPNESKVTLDTCPLGYFQGRFIVARGSEVKFGISTDALHAFNDVILTTFSIARRVGVLLLPSETVCN